MGREVIVSVIIPNYNKGELVRHSLESLMRQTFNEWEAIVVDDCSIDGSYEIAQEYAERDSRIVVMRNAVNKGGNYSRNYGAKAAQGKYLIFLDSDDWLSDDCLENRVSEFESGENQVVDLLVFPMMSTKDGKEGGIWRAGNIKNVLLSFLRHEIVWSIMMPIWRKDAFTRSGGFDESFPRLQDVEFHTRVLLNGFVYKFASRANPDCFYFIDESRMTNDYQRAAEIFLQAVQMYVDKIRGLILGSNGSESEKRHLVNALTETLLAAVRGIGDSYQAGRIEKEVRDRLYSQISSKYSTALVKSYVSFYKMGFNRLKGFNFLFRRVGRTILSLFVRNED